MTKSSNNSFEGIREIVSRGLGNYSFRLRHAFDLRVSPAWAFEHCNADQHLLWVKDDLGYYYFGNEKVELRKGRLIFVSNGLSHRACTEISKPPHICPVRFSIFENNSRREFVFSSPSYFVFDSGEDRIGSFFEMLALCSQGKYGENTGLLVNDLLRLIFADLFFKWEKANENAIDSRVERVRIFLDKNPLNKCSLAELAGQAGLTPKYFSKLFKAQTSCSPKSYQVLNRMRYARFLLLESGLSVKEAAAAVGAADQYVFSRQFKRIFGVSPSGCRW